jgi:ABC-type Zn uptake system ZnuABC Zn-binding protein ZnuA
VRFVLCTRRVAAVVAVGLAAMAGGCSSGGSSAAPAPPKLTVVADVYPLADLARRVGGSRIAVVDHVDPVRGADVVLGIGGMLPAVGGTDPHVWLDPVLWQKVVAIVSQAFERADPAGRADYQRGARDFTAALGALDISYRSSLSDCAHHDFVTSQPKFGRLAARYGLVEDTIGTTHVKTVVLDPIEVLTNPHKSYLSLMNDNLATLISALKCSNSEG